MLVNRGQWIREKHKQRKPFLKLHICVDITQIRAIVVMLTDDSVGDSKCALSLVTTIEYFSISASYLDGAYDTHRIWDALNEKKIKPIIRIRKNARAKGLGL